MVSNIEAPDSKIISARLVCSERITPAASPEEVKNLVFRVDDGPFECRVGQSIRVLAPGQAGKKYHARFYSIADFLEIKGFAAEFTLCVRRCISTDSDSGTTIKGIASNYLCDLKPGGTIEFSGPFGYPFPIPENRSAGIIMLGMGTGIAPFLFLIKQLYGKFGGWEGKVRLLYAAQSKLELLYMNDANSELAKYYDEKTFKALQAVTSVASEDVPVRLALAIKEHADELREMLSAPDTHVYVAGLENMLASVERGLTVAAGSTEAWFETKSRLVAAGRWIEALY